MERSSGTGTFRWTTVPNLRFRTVTLSLILTMSGRRAISFVSCMLVSSPTTALNGRLALTRTKWRLAVHWSLETRGRYGQFIGPAFSCRVICATSLFWNVLMVIGSDQVYGPKKARSPDVAPVIFEGMCQVFRAWMAILTNDISSLTFGKFFRPLGSIMASPAMLIGEGWVRTCFLSATYISKKQQYSQFVSTKNEQNTSILTVFLLLLCSNCLCFNLFLLQTTCECSRCLLMSHCSCLE